MARITYDTDGPAPRRADLLQSSASLWWILAVHKVKRKNPAAVPRYVLFVAKERELEQKTIDLLNGAVARRRDTFRVHPLFWNPR